jgi:TonB family protein
MERGRSLRVLVFVACLLTLVGAGRADNSVKKRNSAARQMDKDLTRLALHKVYVPDFVDTSGRRTGLGCYFGAVFSKLIGENAKNFTIVSRIDVHRYLDKNGLSDSDLSNADVVSKLVSEFSLDGILSGTISTDKDTYTIDFTVRDLSGKEMFRTQYREKIDPVASASIPVGDELSGSNFYFAGLDGVTMPKCLRCPDPSYSDKKRASRVQGSIVLSALITADGKADHIYLLKKLDPDLDRNAIDTVRSWRFEPSRDPNGSIVAVRVPIEVTYRLF